MQSYAWMSRNILKHRWGTLELLKNQMGLVRWAEQDLEELSLGIDCLNPPSANSLRMRMLIYQKPR